MDCREFVISLAEAYGKEITKPRARIYKLVLEAKLGAKFPWRKLFERIVCDTEFEYFPTVAKVLALAGYDARYEKLKLQENENARLESVQSDK